jgi:hypothetical protein
MGRFSLPLTLLLANSQKPILWHSRPRLRLLILVFSQKPMAKSQEPSGL